MDANPDFSAVTTVELEESITSLSANINAATFEQLMLIAEFDNRHGWGHEGARSCAHWLNWRCGISTTTAREKLRVAHALQALPLTRQAFANGELSYSKARAITRVGTAHNEANLLSIARYGTASHLDRTVRLFRKQYVGEDGEIIDPIEAERQAALKQYDNRSMDTWWNEHGCLEISATLPAEQGAVVLKAIEAAVQSLKEVEQAEVEQAKHEEVNSNQSPEHYASDRNEAPAGAFFQNRRADALVLLANQSLSHSINGSSPADRFQVVVHVDSEVLSSERPYSSTGGPDCYVENEAALPVDAAQRLTCSCNTVVALMKGSEPLNIGRSTRTIPTGIKRALAIRDTHCVFPGCDCQKHLDAHHIQHWAHGGETSMENLMRVCHHHHVLLHEGGYSVERLTTGDLRFYKPDGSALSANPTPIKQTAPIQPSKLALWHWNGDSMDYGAAVHGIAQATREDDGSDQAA